MHEDLTHLNAQILMTANPIVGYSDMTIKEAVHLMEDRPSQISVLPIVDPQNVCLGLLRIHDVYQTSLT